MEGHGTVRFTLNGAPIEVGDVPPTTTLLQWLRATGRTGTKEGCAEGDCGACTVALADEGPSGATWRAVDSCLVLLPMLHGREVVTVEGLARDGRPHPAQAAMVERLGSQCGYCTPGIVMSLFEATYRPDLADGAPNAAAKRDDQLCGNLCRCTGYRPIRDACAEVAGTCPADAFRDVPRTSAPAPLAVRRGTQRYFAPSSLAELFVRLDENPDARVVAGATDLGLDVTKKRQTPSLVSLESVPELRRVERIDGGWRVGATALLADLEATEIPLLPRMLRYFASRQIKNRATLGGNVCNASPIGDTPPVLLALGATVVLRSRHGERRVPIDGFFLAYRKTALEKGEILAAVEIPDLPADARAGAYKVSKRRELDISAVAAAFVVRVDGGVVADARLAFGGMAATPSRARKAEAALVGRAWTEDVVEDAARTLDEDFRPIDDHRGTAWYRSTVAKNLLRGFWLETRETAVPTLPERPVSTVLVDV